ncbi:hypothetical protein DSO57_1024447 [Entomophthora muscae]|uniref:Uncharacterized protein n=2 Tax=Entomophthora muscae TaxID=34485 RepID=A0ACC2RHE5_9FUNG|nr:hypothetical protein DSO57_1024447 [Entomophthora muscae]
MFPVIILEEIFSFLDVRTVHGLRLVCSDFYRVSFPILYRVHTLKKASCAAYREFLKKNGKINSDITYSENLGTECLKLSKLKHISIYGWDEDLLFDNLQPVIKNLNSLYVDFCPHRIADNWKSYIGLDVLIMPSRSSSVLLNLQKKFYFVKEIVLVDPKGPTISSKAESNGCYAWINVFPDCFRLTTAHADFIGLTAIPNFAKHCTIINCCYRNKIKAEAIYSVRNIPSLNIVFPCRSTFASYGEAVFKTTKLSCTLDDSEFPFFFKWAMESFSNLQHLYISNVVPDWMLPLSINSFPHLIRFYSKARQSDLFWTELVKAAPKLLYIHTDTIRSNILEFEKMKPMLQLMPYKTILDDNGDKNERSSFNRCLFN